ncbi:MAG: DUF2235 domain-containing protein [Alphaproteobacteria bacterium]|nr:DUF2235 domain-containing protein [Alphaproteobacteria bacterium]
MAKNIVVFADGTCQDGGARPEQRASNIYKMYQISRDHSGSGIDPSRQVAFYDAGLGSDIGATALAAPIRFVQKLMGSLTGAGIKRNIADCYEFIINHYEDGDRIFLFGFSRGGYTVRSLACLLMLCGIPAKTPDGPLKRYGKAARDIAREAVETVLEHGAGHPRKKFEKERLELARRFRNDYGSGSDTVSNVAPYFVGVFDAVTALEARGLRRFFIQAGLAVGIAAAAIVLGFVPSLLVAWPISELLNSGFMLTGFFTQLVVIAGALGWFWGWQNRAVTRTISDFPDSDGTRSHKAVWKGQNFDRLLSRRIAFARSANAIDETRKDFDRVVWAGSEESVPQCEGIDRLKQWWFAGNHCDVGGCYPESESRLSDIALEWMCREAVSVPDGLLTGPIYVNGKKMERTGDMGEGLYIYPQAGGVQHCEVFGLRDAVDAIAGELPEWTWIENLVSRLKWKVKIREIPTDAIFHPTVGRRFELPAVVQCATGTAPYRPEALAGHAQFGRYYPSRAKPAEFGTEIPDSAGEVSPAKRRTLIPDVLPPEVTRIVSGSGDAHFDYRSNEPHDGSDEPAEGDRAEGQDAKTEA